MQPGGNMSDRRRYDRFEVSLPLHDLDFRSMRELDGKSRDISAKGIGMVSDKDLPVGTNLDIWLHMPDNDEEIHTKGTVAWSVNTGPGQFRLGINLEKEDLKPIPIVLRTIHMRTRYYH